MIIIILVIGLGLGYLAGGYWGWPSARRQGFMINNAASETATTDVVGQAISVKARSLVFKTRVRLGENLLMEQKEAAINDQTVIYGLTLKNQDEYYSPEYNARLAAVRGQLSKVNSEANRAAAQKLTTELKALLTEAAAARDLQVKDLTEKLAALPDDSPDKAELNRQLAELNSNYKYRVMPLADVQPNATVEVWSDQDINGVDKFLATKIEVKQ